MTKPIFTLFVMLLSLLIVAAFCGTLIAPLQSAFFANPVFNSMIFCVFVLGVLINVRQVFAIWREVNWVNDYRSNATTAQQTVPNLLSSLAKALSAQQGTQANLSVISSNSLLDSIRSRLDETRELSRYMVGLLIFLGLLGTFWGLLITLNSVSTVIDGLSLPTDDKIGNLLIQLKTSLSGPLAGMGTAFSSSLFGLAGSLILGLLDLQANHSQNRFFNELEEWLAEQTQPSSSTLTTEIGATNAPIYVQTLLEQIAENLNLLQRSLASNEQERTNNNIQLRTLINKLDSVVEHIGDQQQMLTTLTRLDHHIAQLNNAFDPQKSLFLNEFRHEIRLLARTISKITQAPDNTIPDRQQNLVNRGANQQSKRQSTQSIKQQSDLSNPAGNTGHPFDD